MQQAAPHCQAVQVEPDDLLFGLRQVIRESKLICRPKDAGPFLSAQLEKTIRETERQLTEAEVAMHAARLYNKIASKTVLYGLRSLSLYQHDRKLMKGESDYLSETHKPNRLSRHMKATGKSRPPGVAAHAIVSGGHMEARQARKILAQWKIRIDDPDNGVFLPRNSKYIPHPELPEAPNHAKIHTEVYYVNVTRMIGAAQSEEDCRVFLRVIADQLQKGRFKF